LSPFFLVYKIKGLKNVHAFNIAEIIKVSSWDLVESFFLVYYDHVCKKMRPMWVQLGLKNIYRF